MGIRENNMAALQGLFDDSEVIGILSALVEFDTLLTDGRKVQVNEWLERQRRALVSETMEKYNVKS